MSPVHGERSATIDVVAAWGATAVLLASAARFLAIGELGWSVLTLVLVAVALVPSVRAGDPSTTYPPELLALVAVPVLVRLGGWFPAATSFLAVAGLSLLVAIALAAYTSLSLTSRFTAAFTVVTTMALAGAWAVALWIGDAFLGLATLGSGTELMWDLATATAMGLFGGVVFEVYERRTTRPESLDASERSGATHEMSSAPSDDVTGWYRLSVRVMQAGMGLLVVYAILERRWTLVVNSAVPLAATFLPAVLRRERGYAMDPFVVLWVTLASALHAAGAVWFYGTVGWYDSLTHSISAALVATIGYATARAAERHIRGVTFTDRFRVVFVLLFVLGAGVLWELLEFASGGLAALVGGEALLAQHGADDIAKDLLFDGLAGLVVAVATSGRFDGLVRALTGPVEAVLDRD